MNQPAKLIKSKLLSDILGENFSPVARMRLFSRGVQPNMKEHGITEGNVTG